MSNVVIANGGSIPVSQTSFTVTVEARELVTAGSEPSPQHGQLPGDASLITIAARIEGISSGTNYNGSCTGVGGSSSYASTPPALQLSRLSGFTKFGCATPVATDRR